MEELATALPPPRHRPRRHRRKASDSATYGDVFGGGPRFEPPPPLAGAGVPYSDVFGGVAASCSIPYLDLPPAAAGGRDGGAGRYGEIFARFDFGELAAPYEDVFAVAEQEEEEQGMAEEIASWSGSSRSSIRKESGEVDAEPSLLYQHYPNVVYDQHFDDEQFSPISLPQGGEQQFSMSYNKAARGRLDDLVEITTCVVEPSISFVVDSCNLSNDSATDHLPAMEDGTHANGENKEMSPTPVPASSESVADEQQHVAACPFTSENLYEDEKDNRRSSTHSASSEEVPSPDYPFLRVSNTCIQTPPIKVQPPSMIPSTLLNKSTSLNKKESKANGDSQVNPNSAAAAAIKEAMDFAEARLKAAKELMERKGDSFKLRKRSGHHRGTKSTEIKEDKSLEEVHLVEENETLRRLGEEENNYDDLAFLDKCRDNSVVKMVDCCHEEKGVLPPGKPQQMMEDGSKVDQLGKWASSAEFYDRISHDQKCTTNAAACEDDNGLTANPFITHSQAEKAKEEVTTGDLEVYGNLSDGNDKTELRMKRVDLREPDAASLGVEHKASTAPEVSSWEERAVYQETIDSHINKYVGQNNSPKGRDNDKIFETSSINSTPPKLHVVQHISSFSLEACISEDHANGKKNYCAASTEETPLVGNPNKENDDKEELEILCAAETPCTSIRNQISDEHLEVPYISEIETSQEKIAKLEEPTEYHETQCSQKMSRTVHREAETYEKDKLFSSVDEACQQNEKEKISDVPLETLIHEEMKKFETEEKAGPCEEAKVATLEESAEYYETQCSQKMSSTVHREAETYEKDKLNSFVAEASLQNEKGKITEVPSETPIHEETKEFETKEKTGPHDDFQEEDVFWDAGSPEKDANDTPRSSNADANDEAEVLNTFLGDCDMESNVKTCDTFAEDSDQHPESQGSPEGLVNKMDRVENLVSHGNEMEAKQTLSENSEKTVVEETLNHDKESQTSTELDTTKGLNDVYAEIIARNGREHSVLHSGTEVITDDYNDYTMKMGTCSKDLQPSFSEACTSMPHLSQNAESVCALTSGESTPFVENIEECTKSDTGFWTTRYTTSEGKKTVDKMQERGDKDRKLTLDFKDQQSLAEDSASKFAQKSRKDTPDAERVEARDDIRKNESENENENEVSLRSDKDKERECKSEKEQSKEKSRRELEEEKERERERAKDRLAVQRATREAHERAFAEARATAERIALERITSSRQRASAEARVKDKASDEPASEKASREARIKAERAAVERATLEARERAIGKAKAAADAKERIEKEQKAASNNYGRSSDSFNQETEFESALRHKARSERHQRTAERAEKALAEKNMRDMLAQREQTEKHRLSEFLDPEVKRWSNGKEGNLRALLSTLQYILGSDSGWQSVPLTDLITAAAVKKAYRKATLCVHPDKLQQRGATIRQKYICEKVFDLLKEAWNKFNSGER
ncbi:uncharacterized protein [Lolium perenne]|uniref:uncharacterized protein n=1 Tax=Lolium perenne TaxID=4522 RepID=UPI0021F52E15|nr:auxilin-like protein 1 [Lolium perenne]